MIAPVIVAAGIAAAGSVASAAMSKGGAGGGDYIPPSDSSIEYFGAPKNVYFSGGFTEKLGYLGIGAGVVLAIAWLKKAKGKK